MAESEALEKYLNIAQNEQDASIIANKIDCIENPKERTEIRGIFCDELIYSITGGCMEYVKDRKQLKKNSLVKEFLKNVEKIPKDNPFLWAMQGIFSDNEKAYNANLDKYLDYLIKNADAKYGEEDVIDLLVEPFKNAFPNSWLKISEKISEYCLDNGTHELPHLMYKLYTRQSDDEAEEILLDFIQEYPDIVSAREYLALIYMNLKKWNNAIAYFESVPEPVIFGNIMADYYFNLAICYGYAKDYMNEEEMYRKCLEIEPQYPYANNNLGYCLYKQKRYLDAKKVFETILEENMDLPYAANNYIRTLISLGRYKDAKSVVHSKKYKISKTFVDKLKKLPSTNERIKKSLNEPDPEYSDSGSIMLDEKSLSIKGSQFSAEKILEDELTARIEAGMPVFDKNLKIYKRKGSYGRQFIIPIGRLDLLCEDDDGNLYIIELKKDSGYDDAYEQTAEYLNWFENNEISKGKKVFGIICLNDPTKELLDKVHADARMEVYEYRISYLKR